MLYDAERLAVAQTCHRLRRDGLVVGTAGNVSMRVDDHVVVSPSGLDYDDMTAEHVGVHLLDGSPVEAPLAPTSEMPLHLAVYAATDAQAIVHTHAPSSTALACVVDEVPTSHYYSAMFGGAVRVAEYATYGTDELAEHVLAALSQRTAALLANHGALTYGADLSQAHERTRYLEWVCDVQLRAMSSGLPVRTLPEEEIARVRERMAGYGQSVRST